MLARLEEIDGVNFAEVDRRGELLRLRVSSDQARQDSITTLRELGYSADELDEAPPVERWYGHATVRELSREESDVIARRVVPAFTSGHAIAPATAAVLEDVVARALYQCFAAHAPDAGTAPGALRSECVNAVKVAVHDLLSADDAHALAARLSADLDRAESTERRAG